MNFGQFTPFEDGKPDEFQGDVTCPIDGCSISGSEVYVFDHFLCMHKVRKKVDRLLEFLDNKEYMEWSNLEDGSNDHNFTRKKIHREPGIDAHPIFCIEMYESYFGSLSKAEELISNNTRSHCDYNPDNPFPERRKKLLLKQNVKSRTHEIYGSNWGEISWEIYERDGHQCQACFEEGKADAGLDIHHIKPARKFDDRGAMNDESNLICLCNSCHKKYEGMWEDVSPSRFSQLARAAE